MLHHKNGESEGDYISQCIAALIKEGRSKSQAAAICYSKFNEHKAQRRFPKTYKEK